MWMCRNNLRQFWAGHGTPRAPTPSQRAQAVEFSLKICFWTDKGTQWDLYPSEIALGPFSRYHQGSKIPGILPISPKYSSEVKR